MAKRPSAAVTALSDQVVDGFTAFASGHSELGRDFARHLQLHTTDAAALVEIVRAEQRDQPLTPARLGERIGLTSGATSILLNRLEDAGRISRRRGYTDRRLVTLHASRAVQEAAAAFYTPLRRQLLALCNQYSADELRLLEGFADDLRQIVDDYRPG